MSNYQKKADTKSNYQKKASFNAEFIEPLLKDLKLAKERVPESSEMEKFINEIIPKVEKIKDSLNSRENLDRELVGYLGMIERQITPWIDQEPRAKASDLPKKETIKDFLETLRYDERYCVKSLMIFPENTEFKKRLVMYWWAVIMRSSTENVENLFSLLINKEYLIPVYRGEHNKAIDRFTIKPTFHQWLISNSEGYGCIYHENGEDGTWHILHRLPSDEYFTILLNLAQRYLYSNDIMSISRRYGHFGVVQLGNWRYPETEVHNRVEEIGSEETKSKDHIEVDQTDFLKNLEKDVRYLSLRGISGITKLPESIGKLYFLKILDLRACHNLEKLPEKPRSTLIQKLIRWKISKESGWFEKLEVLDISECYLLDYLPKWICDLCNLHVLKGFVVGSLGNKNQSCQLSHLSKLDYLKKLSIRFTNDSLYSEVFRGFNSLNNLLVLTITWRDNNDQIPTYSLPKNLEKLDIDAIQKMMHQSGRTLKS